MTDIYTGGCACGAVRYEIAGDPVAMLECQCRQCQRDSGTGHQSHMVFKAAAVTAHGDVTKWEAVGDGGTVKQRAFCPTCGSPVYTTFRGAEDMFVVTPASLDDPRQFAPQFVAWTAAGLSWDQQDPALPKFDKMPPA